MQSAAQYQQQLQRLRMIEAQQRALQAMAARQRANGDPTEPSGDNNNIRDMQLQQDIRTPVNHQGNHTANPAPSISDQKHRIITFQSACQIGTAAAVESILSSTSHSPKALNFGLETALSASNIEVAQYLLSLGAPITRSTAEKILAAPAHHQIDLFKLLSSYGWNPHHPGTNGAPLLPKVVTNTALVRWFLGKGANPNFGMERHGSAANDKLGYDSCAALESACAKGDLETVCMLFDAGAHIRFGYPLHYAAGALPIDPRGPPRAEAYTDRIPIMEILLAQGADVNQKGETELVAHHPIMYAVMAGAVERVQWLLERGADPEARGSWGSAAEHAFLMGSEEMKAVMEAGIRARRSGGSVGEALAIRLKPSAG
ncbi:hypothetical protein N7532_011417 [Penicillium argentinense]|uniref:Ankyrin n=1 Tax=Penicillium argentinense TaxID=1131581 RepID=A0A9W9EII4_9EURO|nr:uncharacterized protein N7532_011417 [Penicillium argentinense]KAJ5082374.1 hypothetical protein N7532_011417 [Penicillium argentinense]